MIARWTLILAIWLMVGLLLGECARVVLAEDSSPYHGLVNSLAQSCCGQADCAPTEARFTGAQLQILYGGEWVDVPKSAILDTPSWDGRVHACVLLDSVFRGGEWAMAPTVRCVILPGEA